MKLRRMHLASTTALGVLALVGFSNQAHAGAFAYADLNLTNFEVKSLTGLGGTVGAQLTNADTTTGGMAGGNINVTSSTDTFNTSAVIGPGTPTTGPAGTGSSVCAAGGACPNPNAFPFVSAPPISASFSQATTSLTPTSGAAPAGSQPAPIVSFLQPGSGFTSASVAGGASARTTVQSQLTGTNVASANGTIGLNAGFNFNFAGTGTTAIDISLMGAILKIAGTDVSGLSAFANSSWSLTIQDLTTGKTALSWNPAGQTGAAGTSTDAIGLNTMTGNPAFCGFNSVLTNVNCDVISDSFSLNAPNATTSINNNTNTVGPFGPGGFDIQVLLNDGDSYSFVISHNVNDNIVSVPEPGSVALLATGLLGLGAAIRRRRNQA